MVTVGCIFLMFVTDCGVLLSFVVVSLRGVLLLFVVMSLRGVLIVTVCASVDTICGMLFVVRCVLFGWM